MIRRPKITKNTRCARCGVRIRDVHIFSRFTGQFYCVDEKACEARSKRKRT